MFADQGRDNYAFGEVASVERQRAMQEKATALMDSYKVLKNSPLVTLTVETSLPVSDTDEPDTVSTLPHLAIGSCKLTARGRSMGEAIEIIFGMLAQIEPLNYDAAEAEQPLEEIKE